MSLTAAHTYLGDRQQAEGEATWERLMASPDGERREAAWEALFTRYQSGAEPTAEQAAEERWRRESQDAVDVVLRAETERHHREWVALGAAMAAGRRGGFFWREFGAEHARRNKEAR